MGVKGLWKAISPIKESVPITSLRGKVLAVDLAIWVVQSETVTNNAYQGIYLRQTFYKINHLLEHGVGVIIVTDGRAPHLKALTIARRLGITLDCNNKVIQRRRFMKIMDECEALAKSLGITVLKGESEAEAAAAKLQIDGYVDGVITTDGDAFLYGARQVYRNLLVTEPNCYMYDMSRVETELGMSRDDLVGMAILSGCDYNPDGVSGLSRKLVLNYILSRERSRSVTEELTGWSDNAVEISKKYEQLAEIKCKPHCSNCKHTGTKKQHAKSGCAICRTPTTSTPGCSPRPCIPCTCTKHVTQRLLAAPHMQCCVKFVKHAKQTALPVAEIVEEFANKRPNIPISPKWELPSCTKFVHFMHEKLDWRRIVSAEKFSHVAALHHISQNIVFHKVYPVVGSETLQFQRFVKRRRRDKVDMYELEYKVLDIKLRELAEKDIISAILETKFVEYLLPDAAAEFISREEEKVEKLSQKKGKEKKINEEHPPVEASLKDTDHGSVVKLSEDITALHLVDSPPLTSFITQVTTSIAPHGNTMDYDINNESVDSDDSDGYVPLCERLALRRAKGVTVTSSVLSTQSEMIELLIPDFSDYDLLDSGSVTRDLTDNDLLDSGSVTFDLTDNDLLDRGSTESEDEYFDSNVQLLPLNFEDEYLDLTKEMIDDISCDVGQNRPLHHEGQTTSKGHTISEPTPQNVRDYDIVKTDVTSNANNLNVFSVKSDNPEDCLANELSLQLENLSIGKSEDFKIPRTNETDHHQIFFATPRTIQQCTKNSSEDSKSSSVSVDIVGLDRKNSRSKHIVTNDDLGHIVNDACIEVDDVTKIKDNDAIASKVEDAIIDRAIIRPNEDSNQSETCFVTNDMGTHDYSDLLDVSSFEFFDIVLPEKLDGSISMNDYLNEGGKNYIGFNNSTTSHGNCSFNCAKSSLLGGFSPKTPKPGYNSTVNEKCSGNSSSYKLYACLPDIRLDASEDTGTEMLHDSLDSLKVGDELTLSKQDSIETHTRIIEDISLNEGQYKTIERMFSGPSTELTIQGGVNLDATEPPTLFQADLLETNHSTPKRCGPVSNPASGVLNGSASGVVSGTVRGVVSRTVRGVVNGTVRGTSVYIDGVSQPCFNMNLTELLDA